MLNMYVSLLCSLHLFLTILFFCKISLCKRKKYTRTYYKHKKHPLCRAVNNVVVHIGIKHTSYTCKTSIRITSGRSCLSWSQGFIQHHHGRKRETLQNLKLTEFSASAFLPVRNGERARDSRGRASRERRSAGSRQPTRLTRWHTPLPAGPRLLPPARHSGKASLIVGQGEKDGRRAAATPPQPG